MYTHTGCIVFLDRLNGPQERHDKMPTTSIRYSMYAYIMCTNTTVRYGGLAAAVGNTAGSRRYLFINFFLSSTYSLAFPRHRRCRRHRHRGRSL